METKLITILTKILIIKSPYQITDIKSITSFKLLSELPIQSFVLNSNILFIL